LAAAQNEGFQSVSDQENGFGAVGCRKERIKN
jgi:hypothetical protein